MAESGFEKVAETDDGLLVKYLDGEPISQQELRSALRRATIANALVPVVCGSARRIWGIDPLVDEGKAYAERLEQAGVPVDYRLFPRMTHAFFQAPGRLDDSRAASDAAGAALRKAFGND